MENEMRYRETWTGVHRGIRYEVVRWTPTGSMTEVWNYYLSIPLQQVPEEKRPLFNLPGTMMFGRVTHDYYSSPLADLDWHGGITFYDKLGGLDGEPIVVKVGCDYNHLWDEGQTYSKERVQSDAIASIEKLWELFPDLMIRCSWNGRFYPAAEGETQADGRFVSNEGKAERLAKYPPKEAVAGAP